MEELHNTKALPVSLPIGIKARLEARHGGQRPPKTAAEIERKRGEAALRAEREQRLKAQRAIEMALSTVNAKVDYINAHGTSTPAGDIPEINAIRSVFGTEIPPISSTKSLSGHSLGAAGVHEAIYSLLMLEHDFICASANVDNLDPAVGDAPIVTSRIDNAGLNTVISNSFGFGGTNAVLAFQRFNG